MNPNPSETQVISVPDGSIRDYVDGEFRKDTPEEYVRQTIEKRLINEHKYKRERIKIEFGLKLGSRRPRADIVVFPKDSPEMTQDQVWLIVECKKETVEPRNRKDGVEQLKSYMSACPNCEFGHIWRKNGGTGWALSDTLQTSVPPEQLFIERCLQFLKPGGRLAIVLPDSILGNPGLGHIRQWLLEKTRIIASVDLHADAFQPRNGTQTSVLILQKKTQEEINEER